MLNGIIKWFNFSKGYGFITPSDGGADVFLHITALEQAGIRKIQEGQAISYELSTNKAGKTSAANIRLGSAE
jgi:CspA family cold shock protein